MGSFANSIFSVMLGWIRSAADWLWRLAVSQEGSGALQWLGENWLKLAIFLCLCGMAVDMIVHLLRWRPYKVWASFFRRMFGRQQEEEPAEPAPSRRTAPRPRPQPRPRENVRREWIYADGTARPDEEIPHPERSDWSESDIPPCVRPDSAEMSRQYMMQFARPEAQEMPALRYQAELDKAQPIRGLEDYPQPKPSPADQPPAQEVPTQTGRQYKRVARVTARHFFDAADDDQLDLRYKPIPPAVDRREAYGQPYYPPQWRKPADVGASVNREDETHGADGAV